MKASGTSTVTDPSWAYGEVTLQGATPVAVAASRIGSTDRVILELKTVGGVQGLAPVVAVTAGVGFTVAGLALDTSTYKWRVV